MESLLVLAPVIGAGIGTAAGYGTSRRKRRIHFVERKNLNQELERLDVSVDQAERCAVCGDELAPTDVEAIIREDGDYKFVCGKVKCHDIFNFE